LAAGVATTLAATLTASLGSDLTPYTNQLPGLAGRPGFCFADLQNLGFWS